MSQKTSVFNLEQLMDYLGSETFVGVTGAGYEPYKDQSGELRDTERFLLLDDKGFVWSLWVYETEEGFGAEAAYSQSDLAQYGLFFPEGETLEVQIYREPCWLLEAAELVYGLVNRIPAGKLTVPGQYCIPPDELRKIQEEACAGLDLEDELLRLYFRGTALEGVSGRKFCLGCALLYVSFDLAHPEPEEMTRCLKETWYKLRREQYRISGINMFSLGLERAKEPSFQTLAEEIGDLPVPVKLRMQILEVFSAYDVHLDRVVALLRPVAEALPALLRPWVERAAPLVKQWEEFFAAHTPQEFLYRRARVQVELPVPGYGFSLCDSQSLSGHHFKRRTWLAYPHGHCGEAGSYPGCQGPGMGGVGADGHASAVQPCPYGDAPCNGGSVYERPGAGSGPEPELRHGVSGSEQHVRCPGCCTSKTATAGIATGRITGWSSR